MNHVFKLQFVGKVGATITIEMDREEAARILGALTVTLQHMVDPNEALEYGYTGDKVDE